MPPTALRCHASLRCAPLRSAKRVRCAAVHEPKAVEPTAMTFANQLEALKSMSKVVADTGDVAAMQVYKPIDCTTNPSLLLKALQMPEYQHYLQAAIEEEERASGKPRKDDARPWAPVADRLAVAIGAEMLKLIPGRVSTEIDAHLSLDTEATVAKAHRIMALYKERGIGPERVYIKIASTWEGIQACKRLQAEGIDCNMTLLFSFAQGVACANARAALVSPFVGRILDWYKKKEGREFAPEEDPGVRSVRRIYSYYKRFGIDTIVMAASFRSIGEIRELAGCDNITIAPSLLKELQDCTDPLPRKLQPALAATECQDRDYSQMDEAQFREMHEADQMAVDKLTEGINGFAKDQATLEGMIAALAAENVEDTHHLYA